MRFTESFRVALDALRANRLRSLLTMLGVVIGVGAVVPPRVPPCRSARSTTASAPRWYAPMMSLTVPSGKVVRVVALPAVLCSGWVVSPARAKSNIGSVKGWLSR